MTLVGAPDWQQQIAATSTVLGSKSVNSAAVQTIRIDQTLLPQHVAIAVAIIWKPGNACKTVDWQLIDSTLGVGLLLDSAQSNQQPNMQVQPFPGQYVIVNPANQLIVQFAPDGTGVLVADLYVYAMGTLPMVIPQQRLANGSTLLTSGIVNMPAATNGNVLGQSVPGFYNKVRLLSANHVTAAAAVARVSWSDQFTTVPQLETLDLAVANFVWNNVVEWDNVLGVNYNNGSSQTHRVMLSYQQLPQ